MSRITGGTVGFKIYLYCFILTVVEICWIPWTSAVMRLQRKPIYLITAPSRVRPGQVVQVAVNVLSTQAGSLTVRASIRREAEEMATAVETFTRPSFRLLQLPLSETANSGRYSLRLEGALGTGLPGGLFINDTELEFFPKQVSVFISSSKYIHQKRDIIRLRVIAVRPNLLPVRTGSCTIFLKDARNNVVRRWFQQQVINGLVEVEYTLSHPFRYGLLTVVVEGWGHRYEEKLRTINYFPEKIDVNITMPHWIKDNHYGLTGLVRSNMTKGFPTHGNATIELEIQPPSHSGSPFGKLVETIPVFIGAASFMFRMEDIKKHTPQLDGTKLKVSASVMQWQSLESRTAVMYTEIYSSKMRIKFLGGDVRTFKPGVNFPLQIAVFGYDGTRSERSSSLTMSISRAHLSLDGAITSVTDERVLIGEDSIVHYSFIPHESDKQVKVLARYTDNETPPIELIAHRHYTKSNDYLHLSTSTSNPAVDQYLVVTVGVSTYVQKVFYQLISNGYIVLAETLNMAATQKTFAVAVSRDMIPGARILAYCVLNNGEVLADSLSFHVRGIRKDGLKVEVNFGKDFSKNTAELIGKGDPAMITLMSGAQYDLYQRGLHTFLSEQKIEDELMTYDDHANSSFHHTWNLPEFRKENVHFTAPSYAIDANSTFAFAGMLVYTDAQLTRIPGAFDCNFTRGFLPCYDGGCFSTEQRCNKVKDCTDGADEMGCPKPQETTLPDTRRNMWHMEYHHDDTSWLWKAHFTRPNGIVQFTVPVPYRPDTWLVQGISLSTEDGLAFNEFPARLDTTRPFNIEMQMPPRAIKGEQIGVEVTVLNYQLQPIECLVMLHGHNDYRFVEVEDYGIVSAYNPRLSLGDHQTMVYLPAGESKIIHFPILPMVTGQVTVTVDGQSFAGKRQVSASVSVTMDGVTNFYHTPYYIDLVNKGSQFLPDLDIVVPEVFKRPEENRHLYVPGSAQATVSVVGDVVGPMFFTRFPNTENMMGLKWGSGESYIFNFAVNLYMLKYLELTHQLTEEKENWAMENLLKSLSNILAFRMPDGSLSMWEGRSPPCVWCTLFAIRILSQATDPRREYDLYIDPDILDRMVLWAVKQQNQLTGAFSETSPIYDRKMMTNSSFGSSRADHSNITLTAYAVLAFEEGFRFGGEAKKAATISRGLATDYLARNMQFLTDPFEVCVATYALHVAGHREKGDAFIKMRQMRYPGSVYWSRVEISDMEEIVVSTISYLQPQTEAEEQGVAIQATAYALMTYLLNNRLSDADPIMQWLQTQRNTDTAFLSTQDTVVAMEALNEFAFRDTNRALYYMQIDIAATSSTGWKNRFILNRGSFSTYNTADIPKVFGSVRSEAAGSGRALIQLSTFVNVEYDDQTRQPPTEAFDLRIEDLRFTGRNASRFDVTMCARWLRTDLSPQSGFVIFHMHIPTGYHVHKRVLRALAARHTLIRLVHYIRDEVLLYFDYIPSTKLCFDFYAFRWFPVANVTIQHLIRFYEFHDPGYRNDTLYQAWDLFHKHICHVCGSYQCPYCVHYNQAKVFRPRSVLYILVVMICIIIHKVPLI